MAMVKSQSASGQAEVSEHNEKSILPDEQSKNSNSSVRQKIITILVGPEQAGYHFHQDLLCAKSPYFAAALGDQWNHGKDEYIFMDAQTTDFNVVAYWTYKDRLPDDSFDNISTCSLADRLMMHELQNALADEEYVHFSTGGSGWGPLGLVKAFHLELTHTPLYALGMNSFIDIFAEVDPGDENFQKATDVLVAEPMLLREVLVNLQKYNHNQWTSLGARNRCEFHIHPDGKKCE